MHLSNNPTPDITIPTTTPINSHTSSQHLPRVQCPLPATPFQPKKKLRSSTSQLLKVIQL